MDFSEMSQNEILFYALYVLPAILGTLFSLPKVIRKIKKDIQNRSEWHPPQPEVTVGSVLYGLIFVGTPALNILYVLELIFEHLPDVVETILKTPLFGKRKK